MSGHPFTAFLKRFHTDANGGVLILFGLSAVVLILMMGVGIDLGLQQTGHVRLQTASDAAGIAAGSLSATDEQVDDTKRTNAAARYFNLNYPNTETYPRPTPQIAIANGAITVEATATTPTFFGHASLGGWGQSTTTAKTKVSLASQESGKYDMILALDYSESMETTPARIAALRQAANALVDRMLQGTGAERNRVAIVKWSHWAIPGQQVQFTTDIARLKANINEPIDMNSTYYRGTNSTDGLREAKAYLDTISSDRKEEAVRVVVLLTDGANNATVGNDHANIFDQNMKSLQMCRDIKQTGALLYTILLGQDWGPGYDCTKEEAIKSFLSSCATNGKLSWARESSISHFDKPGNPCYTQHIQGNMNIYGGVCRHTSDDRSWNEHGVPGGKVGDWCCIHGWNDPSTGNYECDRWFGQAEMGNKDKYYFEAPNPSDLANIFNLISSVGRMRIVPSN